MERLLVEPSLTVFSLGEEASCRAGALVAALRAEGLSRAELAVGSRPPEGVGLILFDRVDSRLFELLFDVSGAGRLRAVAVAIGPDCLSGAAPWRLLRSGVTELLVWEDPSELALRLAKRLERWARVDALIGSELVRRNVVGQSRAWYACLRQVVEAAVFSHGPMLLTGESGTGKELVARLVHALDPRPDKGELVVLDCTTVVPSLSGSEFFGHERGAFTGAVAARDGAFALANRGTLFLDEIGELPLALQAQLLRVVQEGTFKRVGGNTWHETRFRLVCATNRDLEREIAEGRFRADLYHRIAQNRCLLPPLRARGDDVLELGRHFLAEHLAPERDAAFDPIVTQFLLSRSYPGNVRELRHLIGRIAVRHLGPGPVSAGAIPVEDLPAEPAELEWPDSSVEAMVTRALSLGVGLKEIGRVTSETAIRLALVAENGNLQRAAKLLKVTDRALQMRRAQGAA